METRDPRPDRVTAPSTTDGTVTPTKRLAYALLIVLCSLALLVSLPIVVGAFIIPLIDDQTAVNVEQELKSLPVPPRSRMVDSMSIAGKLVGNGNGMQYFGAILVESGLSSDELGDFYKPYRESEWDCIVAKRDAMPFNLQEYADGAWLANPDPAGNADGANSEDSDYYIVYSWGSNTSSLDWLDLRGH